jgi:hypothetical protein
VRATRAARYLANTRCASSNPKSHSNNAHAHTQADTFSFRTPLASAQVKHNKQYKHNIAMPGIIYAI